MQSNYFWIITLLANPLIVTSSNVERSKGGLVFLKTIIANVFGYNTNNAIMSNENNVKILYPVPNYQLLMNIMPGPYLKPYNHKETFPKILIPSNVVMQPVIYYGKPYVPYITDFNGRNYKAAYANFWPVNGDMQRVIPLPNYNSVVVPSIRCNNKIPDLYQKSVIKDKTGTISKVFGKHESHKLPEFHNIPDTEEISKEVGKQRVSSHPSQSENILGTPKTTPRLTFKQIQSIKTSTTSPSSTVNLVQTKLPYFDRTTLTPKRMQISVTTPPYSTNTQKLITSHVVTISPTLITSRGPPPLSVKNLQTVEPLYPIVLPHEKKDVEINPISTIPADYIQRTNKDKINNNFNPHNSSTNIKIVTSNKSNEGTVFKTENIKYPKDTAIQEDIMEQPSIFSNVIDVINGIAPIKGEVKSEEKPQIYIPQESDDLEVYNQSTDAYPSDNEDYDYLNRSPVIIDEPSYGFVQEEGSKNKLNKSEHGISRFMSSDSDREISRGDIPDL